MLFEKNRHIFWMNDPSILIKNNNFTQFIPDSNMTRVEQLNAITRFSIYFLSLTVMFDKNEKWLYIPIITIIMTVILYNIHNTDDNSKQKELDRILTTRKRNNSVKKSYEDKLFNLAEKDPELFPAFEKDLTQPGIEGGYYDSDNNLVIGEKLDPPKYSVKPPESLYSFNELEQYDKSTCRKPDKNNPFMNPLVHHFNNGDQPSACNVEDEDIKESMDLNFNKDLYRDVEDLWNKGNSQRQFYSVPSRGVPNNQKEFANWLYKNGTVGTCKENNLCLGYEDLRFKR
jgi:hypothetical protein